MNIFELEKRIKEILKHDYELASSIHHLVQERRKAIIIEISGIRQAVEALKPFILFIGSERTKKERECYQRILKLLGLK